MKSLMVLFSLCMLLSAAGAGEAPKPEYLYRMVFDRGKTPGWPLASRKMSRWTFEDGALVQENLDDRCAVIYGLGHVSWSDFEVRMRAKFLKPGIKAGKGITFALKVWNVRVDCPPGGISIWYKKPGAEKASAVHKHDKDFRIDPAHWYDIRIEYHASRLRVKIDGKLVAELTEVPPRPEAGTPLTIYLGNLKCAFDYFRVVDMEPVAK